MMIPHDGPTGRQPNARPPGAACAETARRFNAGMGRAPPHNKNRRNIEKSLKPLPQGRFQRALTDIAILFEAFGDCGCLVIHVISHWVGDRSAAPAARAREIFPVYSCGCPGSRQQCSGRPTGSLSKPRCVAAIYESATTSGAAPAAN